VREVLLDLCTHCRQLLRSARARARTHVGAHACRRRLFRLGGG
jgi:hypothetical protein